LAVDPAGETRSHRIPPSRQLGKIAFGSVNLPFKVSINVLADLRGQDKRHHNEEWIITKRAERIVKGHLIIVFPV
jgi:hypothetical protein